jgi:serine/threonine protein kinase
VLAVEARVTDKGGSMPSANDGDDALPARIDRYVPLRKLATGGMAELYLAKQSGLEGFEKVVVIKQILSHLAQDNEFVDMFLDEARIAAKLSHPNIVQIYDLGKADDSYYIAMEYVSGRNIQHLINKEAEHKRMIPVEHACRVIAGVCDGLYYAHTRKDYDGTPLNIVHRDISPQNVLISFAGGVKLVDFGIAKASTQLAQTRAGVLKGKYAYMSPEQVRGAKVDQRSDVFSVGLVMYEMLTGHRAFERENSLKTLKAIVQEKPLNPKELNPLIPDPVVKLLSKALEKNPDRRYPSAQDMQLAVEDYLETSAKKSNNVRLSRYMYELFDDELHAEGGTMIVQGIGEVIIPTGMKGATPNVPDVEEIDHKTLSAALLPNADQRSGRTAAKADAPVGARLVRDDRAAVPQAPPEAASDEGESDEEAGDDKTIPVYDLEEFERKKQEHEAKKAAKTAGVAGMSMAAAFEAASTGLKDDDDDDFDESLSATIVPGAQSISEGATDEIAANVIADARRARDEDPSYDEQDESTRTVVPGADFALAGLHGDEHTGEGQEDPEWEGGTAEFGGGTQVQDDGPSNGGVRSTDAVIGPSGVVTRGSESAIRPSAGVRPAAPLGAVAHRSIEERQVPPALSTSAPASRGPGEATPVTSAAMVPPKTAVAAAAAKKSTGGMPSWAIAAIAAAGLFLVAALVLLGVIVWRLTDDGPAPTKAQWVQLEVRAKPGASLAVDGEKKAVTVLLVPAGKHTIKVELDGHTSVEREIDVVPPGPVVEIVELVAGDG